MQEIKCPKCGEVFQVDEAGYAAIVKQVRDKEFNKELKEREAQFKIAKEDALDCEIKEIQKVRKKSGKQGKHILTARKTRKRKIYGQLW